MDTLVEADDSPECEERVNVALRLADRHAAYVMGLMVRERLHVPGIDGGPAEGAPTFETS